jgi:hypothetical protein
MEELASRHVLSVDLTASAADCLVLYPVLQVLVVEIVFRLTFLNSCNAKCFIRLLTFSLAYYRVVWSRRLPYLLRALLFCWFFRRMSGFCDFLFHLSNFL